MSFRFKAAALLAVATVLAGLHGSAPSTVSADPANVSVGDQRTPVNRGGTPLRAEPNRGGQVLGNVLHGTRLRVEAVENGYLKVTTEVGDKDKSTKTGWVRAVDTVQPFALTGQGQAGPVPAGARVSSTEATAAGRGNLGGEAQSSTTGFNENTEKSVAEGDAQMQAAFPLVDKVEATNPSPAEVQKFAKDGRLGFPGRTR